MSKGTHIDHEVTTSLEELLALCMLIPMGPGEPWEDECLWGAPVMLWGPPGIGKCLGIGTQVLLHNGRQVAVEDVRTGDFLMGPDSKPRRVLSTTVGTGQLFKVIPTKGDPWICNDVHVLTLVASHTGKIIDIPLDDYLRKSATFKVEHKQFFTDVDFLESVELPVDPYFLGVWYGDGHKADKDAHGNIKSVRVSKPDAEVYALMQETAKQWGLTVSVSKDENRCPSYSISSGQGPGLPRSRNELLHVMRELVGDCSSIPHCYRVASRSARSAFLAGVLDTDGHYSSGCYEVTQKNKGVAADICFIARSLGIRATMVEKIVNDTSYWRVLLSGELTVLPLRIARKVPKPRKQCKDVTRTGIRVEAIGEGDYAGFTLDGDGRFLLGDFTVTHNTARVRQAGKSVGLETRVVELGGRQPEDASGVPFLNKEEKIVVACVLPAIHELLNKGEGILFLDELTLARPATQGAFLSAVQERRIGDTIFPPKVRVICAGNPPGEAAGGHFLEPPMANRLLHIDVDPPSVDEFMDYMTNGPAPRQDIHKGEIQVIEGWNTAYSNALGSWGGFLKKNGVLHKMPPNSDARRGKAWPSPRSNEVGIRAIATANILGYDINVQTDLLSLCLGSQVAADWSAWQLESQIPSAEEILNGNYEWNPRRLDQVFAALSSCTSLVRRTKGSTNGLSLATKHAELLNKLWSNNYLGDIVLDHAKKFADMGYTMTTHPELKPLLIPLYMLMKKEGMDKMVEKR